MNGLLDLSNNPLFDVLKPKPDDQRRFLILVGYISATAGDTVTVYPNLDLTSYLEIPRSEIAWAEKAIPGQECSPTKLVINGDAKVNRVTTAARRVEAGFLSGMITARSLPTSAGGVTINVSVDESTTFSAGSTCPTTGHATSKGSGPSSACRFTGLCVSDLAYPTP
jgi:hypothetical protein